MVFIESGFGARLRLFRVRRALTQTELAERAGINAATINRLERSTTDPRPSTVRKLAQALGVKPLELTTESKP